MLGAKAWVLVGGLALCACGRVRYQPPAVPANQLAIVTVDQRATLVAVEKLPVTEYASQRPPDRVFVAAGCRRVSATYQATYFQLGKGGSFHDGSLADQLEKLGGAEKHTYRTNEPITFHFQAKGGMTYWVTASFNGEDFLPRLVEFDAAGERRGAFYPDSPCPADAKSTAK
jgi:hypothetical protein